MGQISRPAIFTWIACAICYVVGGGIYGAAVNSCDDWDFGDCNSEANAAYAFFGIGGVLFIVGLILTIMSCSQPTIHPVYVPPTEQPRVQQTPLVYTQYQAPVIPHTGPAQAFCSGCGTQKFGAYCGQCGSQA